MELDNSCAISKKKIIFDRPNNAYAKTIGGFFNYNLSNAPNFKIPLEYIKSYLDSINATTKEMGEELSKYCKIFSLNILKTKKLSRPLDILVEYDEDYFLARATDFPIHAGGSDPIEAVENIKQEIEDLYNELLEDDNFSAEWLNYKSFLMEIVSE